MTFTLLLREVLLSLEKPNAAQSPFAAQTETFQIHSEPQAGSNTVQWV
jgi:hypothetical protein